MLQTSLNFQKRNIRTRYDEKNSQLQYIEHNSVVSDEENSFIAEVTLKHVSQKIVEKTEKSSTKQTQTINDTMKKMKFKAISSINDVVDKEAKLKTFTHQIYDDSLKKELKIFSRCAFISTLLLSININQSQINDFFIRSDTQRLKNIRKKKQRKSEEIQVQMNIVTLSKTETFDRLNINARRYYLIFLFKKSQFMLYFQTLKSQTVCIKKQKKMLMITANNERPMF